MATSTGRNDPVIGALLDAGVSIGQPGRGEMSPVDYNRLQVAMGEAVHGQLGALIGGPDWQWMSRAERKEAAEELIGKTRKRVRRGLFGAPLRKDAADWSSISSPAAAAR